MSRRASGLSREELAGGLRTSRTTLSARRVQAKVPEFGNGSTDTVPTPLWPHLAWWAARYPWLMREAVIALVAVIGFLWILAVLIGLLAGTTKLTARRSFVGRVARVCRAVALLAP